MGAEGTADHLPDTPGSNADTVGIPAVVPPIPPPPPDAPVSWWNRKVTRRIRAVLVVVFIVLGAILSLAAPPAIFARNLLLNTDRYVEIMTPLSSDPAVQSTVIAAVDKQVETYVDVRAILTKNLPALSFLAAPLQQAVNNLINSTVTDLVQSEQFSTLWVGLNKVAHRAVVAILTGQQLANGAIKIESDQLVLDLAPVVDAVKTKLVDKGLSAAAAIPVTGTTIVIAQVPGVDKARGLTRLLDKVANWLPFLAIGMFALAVALAQRRRRAIIASALSLAGAMVLLGLGLLVGRNLMLANLPPQLPSATATSVFDTLVRYLRTGLRITLLVALLIALVAILFGPGPRRLGAKAFGWLGQRAARWRSSSAGAFLSRNRVWIWVTIVGLAGVILVLWDQPSLGVVLTVLVIAILLLVIAEVLRPRRRVAPARPA